MRIAGSGVIVAGGSSGLGLAAAQHLARSGAIVGIVDLKPNPGWAGPFAAADISDADAVAAALDALADQLPGFHALLNTTGTGGSGLSAGPGKRVSAEIFRRVLEVNTLGSFILTQAAADRLVDNVPDVNGERGVIINTSSIVAFEGQIGTAAYAAAKAGIHGMTLPLAREFARFGIRVMTIAPGIFETPMFSNARGPMVDWLREQVQFPARPGEADEFARFAGHIIENPMLNGTVVRLDGAYRVPPGRHEWWEAAE